MPLQQGNSRLSFLQQEDSQRRVLPPRRRLRLSAEGAAAEVLPIIKTPDPPGRWLPPPHPPLTDGQVPAVGPLLRPR